MMPQDSSDINLPGAVANKNDSSSSLSSLQQQPLTMNLRKGIKVHKSQENIDEPDQVVFMGIIDILVPFDKYKKGEYVFKSLLHAGKSQQY